MTYDPTFWVAVAFFLLIVLIYRPVKNGLGAALDSRAHRIRIELEEAVKLREEAQALLAAYQRRQRETLEEAERIVMMAESQAKQMLEEARHSLESTVKKRTELAEQKVARMEAKVVQDIRDRAVDVAVQAVRTIIQEHMTEETARQLVEKAVGEVEVLSKKAA